jgi:hypothetical protein
MSLKEVWLPRTNEPNSPMLATPKKNKPLPFFRNTFNYIILSG